MRAPLMPGPRLAALTAIWLAGSLTAPPALAQQTGLAVAAGQATMTTPNATANGGGNGLLCEVPASSDARATPQAAPAVESMYSSWGNEALWQ